jgi:hypothetical protein
LFNIPSCVLIQQHDRHTEAIPTIASVASLPAHEMKLTHARPHLHATPTLTHFVDSDIRSPHYHRTILSRGKPSVPRNLCFVEPEGNISSPAVISDPELDKDAKVPYKGVSVRGEVNDPYVYSTLLSKHLFPFGVEKFHMVALPVILEEGTLRLLTEQVDFIARGHGGAWGFFKKAIEQRDRLEKRSDIGAI